MTTRELTSTPVVGEWSRLPWGTFGDVSGLLVAVSLAARQVEPRHSGMFLYLLFGSGLVTWLVVRQLQPRLPGFVRQGYRFVLAPPLAAVLTLVVCAAFRDYYSRAAIAYFVACWSGWVAIGRYSLRKLASPLRVLCVGDSAIARELSEQERFHVQSLRAPTTDYHVADVIVVGAGAFDHGPWLRWLLNVEMSGIPLMSARRARESLTGRVALPILEEEWARGGYGAVTGYMKWKRGLDVIAVVVLAPLIALLCAFIGLAVLLESGRPIIFSQVRVGQMGRHFRIYKFRTMRTDAELGGAAFARADDPRVTRVGRWLRRTRLDELPQFWNVLRGQMSIIGPRPEQWDFARDFDSKIPSYAFRQSMRPGITGWAQVRQGYAAGRDETEIKLSYDLYYVKHRSVFLDVLILAHTIRIVALGRGAR